MASTDDMSGFTETCTQFVRSAISILPSVLSRLAYLASLRDLDTGEYQDQVLEALLALRFGRPATDCVRRDEQVIGVHCGKAELNYALRREHLAVFEEWLCLNLQQQTAQLECYASRQGVPSCTLSGKWIREKSYERLIPSGAMQFQRRLFVTDLKAVLSTLSGDRTP